MLFPSRKLVIATLVTTLSLTSALPIAHAPNEAVQPNGTVSEVDLRSVEMNRRSRCPNEYTLVEGQCVPKVTILKASTLLPSSIIEPARVTVFTSSNTNKAIVLPPCEDANASDTCIANYEPSSNGAVHYFPKCRKGSSSFTEKQTCLITDSAGHQPNIPAPDALEKLVPVLDSPSSNKTVLFPRCASVKSHDWKKICIYNYKPSITEAIEFFPQCRWTFRYEDKTCIYNYLNLYPMGLEGRKLSQHEPKNLGVKPTETLSPPFDPKSLTGYLPACDVHYTEDPCVLQPKPPTTPGELIYVSGIHYCKPRVGGPLHHDPCVFSFLRGLQYEADPKHWGPAIYKRGTNHAPCKPNELEFGGWCFG